MRTQTLPRTRGRARAALAPLAAAALVGLPLAMAAPAAAADHSERHELMAWLEEVTGSGASGTVWGELHGTELTLKIETTGLLENAPHAQHIHIGGANECPGPDVVGTGAGGAIRTTDAIDSYGPVVLSLTKSSATDADHALHVEDFPVGNEGYERTFEVTEAVAADIAAGRGVVVIHGVDHNGSGEYDGDQESDLDPSLPSEATDPAACGVLEAAQMDMPDGPVATGGAATQGVEYGAVIALGTLALGAGVAGLAYSTTRRTRTEA